MGSLAASRGEAEHSSIMGGGQQYVCEGGHSSVWVGRAQQHVYGVGRSLAVLLPTGRSAHVAPDWVSSLEKVPPCMGCGGHGGTHTAIVP